jgi:hypothetical protein
MAAMKRTILVLSVLWVLAGTAPASAAFLGENPRLGENFLNTGIGQAAGDVNRDRLPGSCGSCLERPAGCFVAPMTILFHGWHSTPGGEKPICCHHRLFSTFSGKSPTWSSADYWR